MKKKGISGNKMPFDLKTTLKTFANGSWHVLDYTVQAALNGLIILEFSAFV